MDQTIPLFRIDLCEFIYFKNEINKSMKKLEKLYNLYSYFVSLFKCQD